MKDKLAQVFEEFLKRVTPQSTIFFANGLPGFPEETRFVLLQNPDERPFAWLQSLRTAELAFVVTSPFALFPEYRPDVSDADLAAIGSPAADDTLVLCILRVIDGASPELHTNLKAPVVINLQALLARQVILGNEAMYSERAVYHIKSS